MHSQFASRWPSWRNCRRNPTTFSCLPPRPVPNSSDKWTPLEIETWWSKHRGPRRRDLCQNQEDERGSKFCVKRVACDCVRLRAVGCDCVWKTKKKWKESVQCQSIKLLNPTNQTPGNCLQWKDHQQQQCSHKHGLTRFKERLHKQGKTNHLKAITQRDQQHGHEILVLNALQHIGTGCPYQGR